MESLSSAKIEDESLVDRKETTMNAFLEDELDILKKVKLKALNLHIKTKNEEKKTKKEKEKKKATKKTKNIKKNKFITGYNIF